MSHFRKAPPKITNKNVLKIIEKNKIQISDDIRQNIPLWTASPKRADENNEINKTKKILIKNSPEKKKSPIKKSSPKITDSNVKVSLKPKALKAKEFDKKNQEKIELNPEGVRKKRYTKEELYKLVKEAFPWIILNDEVNNELNLEEYLYKLDSESIKEFEIRSELSRVIYKNNEYDLHPHHCVALSSCFIKSTQGYNYDSTINDLLENISVYLIS